MEEYGPEFVFGNQPVGLFRHGISPAADGVYEYEPYRGPGHYSLQQELKSSHIPRCYYDSRQRRVSFSVVKCPSYGLLELAGFETENIKP